MSRTGSQPRNPHVFAFLTKSVLRKPLWFTNVTYQKHVHYSVQSKKFFLCWTFINCTTFIKITGNFYMRVIVRHISILSRFPLFYRGLYRFAEMRRLVHAMCYDRCYPSTPRSPTSFSLADSVVLRRPRRIAPWRETHSTITSDTIELPRHRWLVIVGYRS